MTTISDTNPIIAKRALIDVLGSVHADVRFVQLLITADLAKQLHALLVQPDQLTAMRDFIRTKLPALNAIPRGERIDADEIINDICRAVDQGNDPTTPEVPNGR